MGRGTDVLQPNQYGYRRQRRVWITEAVNYRDFNTKPAERLSHKQKGDRVMILEDKDGDGKAESSKVYLEDSLLTAPLWHCRYREQNHRFLRA
jgi:hypothetical protein